jgi:hypothetical protein
MLSDCEKCWETPCKCGYDYKDWTEEALVRFILNILTYKEKGSSIYILSQVMEIKK